MSAQEQNMYWPKILAEDLNYCKFWGTGKSFLVCIEVTIIPSHAVQKTVQWSTDFDITDSNHKYRVSGRQECEPMLKLFRSIAIRLFKICRN